MGHINRFKCDACTAILHKYPNFSSELESWFTMCRAMFPELHVAEAGRDKINQELMFSRGASKAHYGQSAHNYNQAMDLFFQVDGKYNLDESRFEELAKKLPDTIEWYGKKDAVFYERPHFEVKNWRNLVDQGKAKLVV